MNCAMPCAPAGLIVLDRKLLSCHPALVAFQPGLFNPAAPLNRRRRPLYYLAVPEGLRALDAKGYLISLLANAFRWVAVYLVEANDSSRDAPRPIALLIRP
jgi:hypothetical protein